MTVLWCPIYYSQEARAYIFLILFSILSIYYWIPIVEDLKNNLKPNKRDIIFYVIYSSLCCYTHYFGGYFIALQGFGTVVLFLSKKSAWGAILLIYACIVLAFSPWIPVFFSHLRMGSSALAISPKPISLIYLLKFIGFVFNAQKSTFIPFSSYTTVDVIISTSIILLTTGLIVSLAAIKFYNYFIGKKRKVDTQYALDRELLLYCWLVIPFLGLFITRKIPKFDYYYLLISLPPAYLLISKSITTLFTKPKIHAIVAVVFCALFAIHLIYDKKYYSEPNKEQFREAVQYAVENDRRYPESKIIGFTYDRFFDYYLKRNGSAKRIDLYINDKKGVVSETGKIDLIGNKYLWLISAHLTPDEKFINCLLKDYKIIHNESFILANAWLFEKLYPERAMDSRNICFNHSQTKLDEK
jgi:heme/copper-type cytochrome/quinol oxidase subunit 2